MERSAPPMEDRKPGWPLRALVTAWAHSSERKVTAIGLPFLRGGRKGTLSPGTERRWGTDLSGGGREVGGIVLGRHESGDRRPHIIAQRLQWQPWQPRPHPDRVCRRSHPGHAVNLDRRRDPVQLPLQI